MSSQFPKAVRLPDSAPYQRIFTAPELKSSDRYFTVLGRLIIGSTSARLGLVVAKKNIRRAHERNRIKRLVRESFRQRRDRLPPLDLIVLARSAGQEAENQQLFHSLHRHWRRLTQNHDQPAN